MPQIRRSHALPFLLALPIGAQSFVVDANNGPGTDFTDLPPAIAAVPDGAVLFVRPGSYGPIHLQQKGMTIAATAPGVVLTPASVPIMVTNLAAQQSVTLRGITAVPGPTFLIAHVLSCAGPVTIDDFHFQSDQTYASFGSTGVFVEGSAQVAMRDCAIQARWALQVASSTVAVENCVLRGHDAYFVPHVGSAPGTGLVADGSQVELARCQVFGGASLTTEIGPAIYAHQSTVRLAEDQTCLYLAGANPFGVPVPAVSGLQSTLVRTPDATLVPTNGGPAVAPAVTDVIRALPSLRSLDAPPGGIVQANISTPVGELVFGALALPIAPVVVPGIDGTLWIDPTAMIVTFAGVPIASLPVQTSFAIPNDPTLSGLRFVWQALALDPAAGGLRLSNPSIYVP